MNWPFSSREHLRDARKQQILKELDAAVGHCIKSKPTLNLMTPEGEPVKPCPYPRLVDQLLERILELEDELKNS